MVYEDIHFKEPKLKLGMIIGPVTNPSSLLFDFVFLKNIRAVPTVPKVVKTPFMKHRIIAVEQFCYV